jgi:hypothetical protein
MALKINLIKYTGAVVVPKGVTINGSGYQSQSILKMKSSNVSVSVNGSPMFKVSFDDETLVDTTATYMFDSECTIAVGLLVEVQL